MPLLSRQGRMLGGIDGIISVDDQIIDSDECSGWTPQWITDTVIGYQRKGQFVQYDLTTGQTLAVLRGYNWLAGGGGVWAKCDTLNGYLDSYGKAEYNWLPLKTDLDSGKIALLSNRVAGQDLAIWDGTTLTPLINGIVYTSLNMSFKRGVLSVQTRPGGVTTFDCTVDPPRRTDYPQMAGLHDAVVDGPYGMSWHDNYGLVVYRLGTTEGVQLSFDGRDFNPDMMVLPDGQVRVVSALGAGERPGGFRVYTFNYDALPKVNLAVAPPEVVKVPGFPLMSQPMGYECADDPDSHFLSDDPGTKGIFWTVNDPKNQPLEPRRQLAMRYGVPLYCYFDGHIGIPHMPAVDGCTVIPMMMAYPLPGENASNFKGRIRELIKDYLGRFPGKKFAVYGALYRQVRGDGSYNLGEQQVLDCIRALWDLCAEYRVRALVTFAWTRGTTDGVIHIPSFREAHNRMLSALPSNSWPTIGELGPPVPLPVPVPPKPEPIPQPIPEPTPEPPPPTPEPDPITDPIVQEPTEVPPPVVELPPPPVYNHKNNPINKYAPLYPVIAAGVSALISWFRRKRKK